MSNKAINEYKWSGKKITPGHLWIDPVVLKLVKEYAPMRVLDLGCGNGILTKKIADIGIDVIGIDPSVSGIAEAKNMHPGIDFRACGAYDDPLDFELGTFDLIISEEVIEHMYYPDELLRFGKQVLNSDGKIIITTPYYGYLRNLALALINRWDHHLTPLWNHGHIKLFSKKSMNAILLRNGLKMVSFKGAGNFRYFWKSMVVTAKIN